MLKPKKVTDADIVFGGKAMTLLPPYANIPDEFKRGTSRWNRVVRDWFFKGLSNCQWIPKEGVDTTRALRHIKAIMGSFEPKHEHKEAGCAYLLSEFFEDVTYEKAK